MFTLRFSDLPLEAIVVQAKNALNDLPQPWEEHIWQFIINWADSGEKEIEIKTSGSTGAPKTIKHRKDAMWQSAMATCKFLQVQPNSTALLCLPANKIGGMMMLVRCLYNRMDLVCIQPTANPIAAMEPGIKIDFAAFTPMQVKATEKDYSLFKRFETIGTVILGGEEVAGNFMSFLKASKNSIYVTFGMTETISHIALKRINGAKADEHFNTLPGVTVSADNRQCLVINAPTIDVYNLATNDLVNVLSPQQFDWLGRIDNVINTGGIKVIPEVVEQKIKAHFAVPFFITGIPDTLTGQKVILAIEIQQLKAEEKTELEQTIAMLDKYERPREVWLIPQFAKTENGKVKRMETLQRKATVLPL